MVETQVVGFVEEGRQVGRQRALQEVGAHVDVASRGPEQIGIDQRPRRSPIVPSAVSMARSSGVENTTVTPVGRRGSTAMPRVSPLAR